MHADSVKNRDSIQRVDTASGQRIFFIARKMTRRNLRTSRASPVFGEPAARHNSTDTIKYAALPIKTPATITSHAELIINVR